MKSVLPANGVQKLPARLFRRYELIEFLFRLWKHIPVVWYATHACKLEYNTGKLSNSASFQWAEELAWLERLGLRLPRDDNWLHQPWLAPASCYCVSASHETVAARQ